MEAKKKEPSLQEKLKEAALSNFINGDFPSNMARIEIFGDKKIVVENHKGIIEYGDTLMRINCGKYVLKISGMDLELRAMNVNELAIVGKILGAEYI